MSDSQSVVLDLALVLLLLVVVLKVGIPKILSTAFEWHEPPTLNWSFV